MKRTYRDNRSKQNLHILQSVPCYPNLPYSKLHRDLERAIASFLGYEDAIVCSSGFGINDGVLRALLSKNDLALVDTAIHASVLNGLCGTNVKYIGHNNPDYLEYFLRKTKGMYRTQMVILDGVYSQEGDIAPLLDFVAIVQKYGAYLMVDDAHGIGVLGANGAGTLEHFGIQGMGLVNLLTGTLSKALGTVGGFACGSKELISYLRYFAANSVFSAAPTPQASASALKAIEVIRNNPICRAKLWENISLFREELIKRNIGFGATESAIFPIRQRNGSKHIKELSKELLKRGFYAPGILYPAVKENDPRIRASILATHTKEDIVTFAETLDLLL